MPDICKMKVGVGIMNIQDSWQMWMEVWKWAATAIAESDRLCLSAVMFLISVDCFSGLDTENNFSWSGV